jgi:hypothetical protein
MTTEPSELVTLRPQAVAPSWSWVVRRAVFGLVVMIAVTSLAAYLAHASIESIAEPSAEGITIGAPAAALLK